MSNAIIETEPRAEQAEAYQTLLTRVGRKSPKIPPDVLVRHVLSCVPPTEWPARVGGDGCPFLSRLEFARRDELRFDSKASEGRVLGLYTTRRMGEGARPYRTVLAGVDPIAGRCDCPDFIKNSLGVCKHNLVLLENLYFKSRLLRQAQRNRNEASSNTESGLHWDPIRPLTGLGDWLERVTWVRPSEAKGSRSERVEQALKWFHAGENGKLVLKRGFENDAEKRLALVENLLKVVPSRIGGTRCGSRLCASVAHHGTRAA